VERGTSRRKGTLTTRATAIDWSQTVSLESLRRLTTTKNTTIRDRRGLRGVSSARQAVTDPTFQLAVFFHVHLSGQQGRTLLSRFLISRRPAVFASHTLAF
jgi:hypothetical protein